MIFQFFFTLILIGILIYGYLQKNKLPFFFYLLTTFILLGIYLLWSPITATKIANLVGIGRGADLLLYIWVVISILLITSIHYKIQQLIGYTTILSRKLAILESEMSEKFNKK